jgi:phosphodiesterase/alkaline phosphatase D-like protein
MQIRTVRFATFVMIVLFAGFARADTLKITKGPVVEHAGNNTAVIAWSTNSPSATIVKFGTDEHDLNRTAQMPWGGLTHRVTLKNLEPGKTYYFEADSSGGKGSGSGAVSPIGKFVTGGGAAGANKPAEPRAELKLTNGPVIEHVGTDTATIAWSTSLPSSSIVKYGTDRNSLGQNSEQPWGATTHRVQLKNLKPRTQYYFSVQSAQGKNAPGQKVDTPPQAFTTK